MLAPKNSFLISDSLILHHPPKHYSRSRVEAATATAAAASSQTLPEQVVADAVVSATFTDPLCLAGAVKKTI